MDLRHIKVEIPKRREAEEASIPQGPMERSGLESRARASSNQRGTQSLGHGEYKILRKIALNLWQPSH